MMNRKLTSFWIRVIISVVIGLACFFALQQSAQAGSSLPAPVFASPIPGNLMVYRVGTGGAGLTSAATAVFVDEYTITGALVQSIPVTTTGSGTQRILTASGTATSEGLLTLSENRQFVILTGYDAAVGTAAVATTASATTNRVIGRIDIAGNVDTSTTINDAFTGNNIRSAASDDGTRFWATGSIDGVRYVLLGNTGTSTSISTSFTNLRVIKVAGGQLYVSAGASTLRFGTVGTGLPTTTGQTITNLPGIPTTGSLAYSFYIADLSAGEPGYDTLYLTDDTASVIRKFSLVSGTWTANGTITLAGVRGLTGVRNGSSVTLYATSATTLSTLVDASGYNTTMTGTPSTLATATTNTAFRGVAFAPGTSPTAVQVANLSAHPTDSTPLFLVIALGLVGMASAWLILRRRSRAA
jgi:hypothetical protein